ncbi:MAG TPA: hypothetical protein VJS43_13210 [Candidatus Acidoferrales bacterium]|nr:hypothetical protein [Candidatus Acidoferrales bacterium]
MPVCDGCGATVDSEHIRSRIERLQMATRYRPVHIQTLLVGTAPPERLDEYVYASERDGTELQHNGIFLVYAAECPLPNGSDAAEAVRRAAPTLIKRVQFSYKPKSIVLFSPATLELIPALNNAGFRDQLILKNGAPFPELPDLAETRATKS